MRKVILSLTAAALFNAMLLTLAACGKNGQLRSDVTVADLSAAVEPLIVNASHLDTADVDYLRFNLDGTAGAAERLVRLSISGTSLDEYGIFRAASPEDTGALADACKAYLQKRNDAWMHTYMVEEYPKLRDAEVKVIGQYVVYLILTEAEKEAVTAKITETLK